VARPRRLPALRRARCRPGYGQQLFERAQVVIDRPFASPSITGSANLSRPLASATRVNVTLVLGPDGSKPHVVVTRVPRGRLPGKPAIGLVLGDLVGRGQREAHKTSDGPMGIGATFATTRKFRHSFHGHPGRVFWNSCAVLATAACDEGAYLGGDNEAPPPLVYFSAAIAF
jgi:hypothetical protein